MYWARASPARAQRPLPKIQAKPLVLPSFMPRQPKAWIKSAVAVLCQRRAQSGIGRLWLKYHKFELNWARSTTCQVAASQQIIFCRVVGSIPHTAQIFSLFHFWQPWLTINFKNRLRPNIKKNITGTEARTKIASHGLFLTKNLINTTVGMS